MPDLLALVAVGQAVTLSAVLGLAWRVYRQWREDQIWEANLERGLHSTIEDMARDARKSGADIAFMNEEMDNGLPVLAVVAIGGAAADLGRDLDLFDEAPDDEE